MAIINKYGFDFDGATRIGFYKNADLNLIDTKYKFTVKKYDNNTIGWLVKSTTPTVEATWGVSFQFAASNELGVLWGDNSTSFIVSGDSYNVGDVLDVEFIMYENPANPLAIKGDLYVNGSIVATGTRFITANPFKIHGSIRDYSFGATDTGAIPQLPSYIDFTQSILSNFTIETNGVEVFKETFDNTTIGSIAGTEQYAVISTTEIPGILVEKKQNWTNQNTRFQEIVYDWFFGDSFKLTFDGVGTKDMQIGVYDDKLQGFFLAAVKNTTDNNITIDLPNKQIRRIAITIDSENDLDNVEFLISSVFEIMSNTEQLPTAPEIVDSNVLHNATLVKNKTIGFKVPDELVNTAKSLFQNKVYLDNVLYQVSNISVVELDINNKVFNVSFFEVLNG